MKEGFIFVALGTVFTPTGLILFLVDVVTAIRPMTFGQFFARAAGDGMHTPLAWLAASVLGIGFLWIGLSGERARWRSR